MKISNIINGSIFCVLVFGIYHLIKIENSLNQLNGNISKFKFYTKSELREIEDLKDEKKADSLLDLQTVLEINGYVRASVNNTVDVKIED